jgi:hypothetical protein
MASEPFPELVFEITQISGEEILRRINQTLAVSPILRIVNYDSRATWELVRLDTNGNVEAQFELFVSFGDIPCKLFFSANTESDSAKLVNSVMVFLGTVFKGSPVLRPDLQPLQDLPGLSEASGERIATLLKHKEAMTLTEISKSLNMREYTIAINIQSLLKRGIVGCTPPDIEPRKYFCK